MSATPVPRVWRVSVVTPGVYSVTTQGVVAVGSVGGGGGGAPTDAQYVVAAAGTGLSAERVLTQGTGITVTTAAGTITVANADGGAAAVAAHDASGSAHAGRFDAFGTAALALASHVAAADPHTQYLLESAAAAAYQPLATRLTEFVALNPSPNSVLRFIGIGGGGVALSTVGLAQVAFSGAYSDLSGAPTLGTLASQSGTFSGGGTLATGGFTLTVAGTASVSGTNTGDQTIALTGDVTGSGTGSFAATLASVITAGGPTGSATAVPVITWDAKGRLTAVTTAAITAAGLGATTVGGNLFALANPSAVRFLRVNADNSVSALSDSDFRAAIGAGTSSTAGTVTSVNLTAPAAGITVSGGPVTAAGSITLALADDLAALEALSGTNTIYYRSAASTWAAVTIGSGLSFSGGTLSSTAGGGSVTSVDASGGTTGLSFSGGPVTGSGTLTLSGTLAKASGGTGEDNSAGGTANTFWARPNGATGAASYRAIVAADVPTLNQNTTGSAATLTTGRNIYGNPFNGSADLTQVIASTYGGTGNGFAKFSGPAASEKTFTLPNANATLLYDAGPLGTPSSGTATNLTGLPASGLVAGAAGKGPRSNGTAVSNTFPAGDLTTATDGATVTFNLATSQRQLVTLGGNRTLALSNDADGMAFTVILKQDGTGSRTVTWWSGIKWAGGTPPTLTTTAGKYDVFAFLRVASGEYLGFQPSLNH